MLSLFGDETTITRVQRAKQLPHIPPTTWRPGTFASLASAKCISIDTETFDPELLDHGPGWGRKRGHIVGVSVATDDGFCGYYPVRHTVGGEQNLDPRGVFAWLRDELGRARQPKIGANLLYDIGWLREENVTVRGSLYDVQFAEALLSENAPTALDHLGQKYCGTGKDTSGLYRWCAQAYGGAVDGDQRANIWRAPPSLTGFYAEQDAVLPLRILRQQLPLLAGEGLSDLMRMECGLIPLLIDMRMHGVRVDVNRAAQLSGELFDKEGVLQRQLENTAGCALNVNEGASLARAFDRAGIWYPRTAPSDKAPQGNPSFVKKWLEAHPSQLAREIVAVRRVQKLRTTFIDGYILNGNVRGRVHCSFHPLRSSKYGTRSGRFASANPNLQNVPSRDEELAALIRGLFIPDEGHKQIRRHDYSQIEYRCFVSDAVGPGADNARATFNSNPNTDYHEWTLDLVAHAAGWDISTPSLRKQWRKPVKNINFGLLYGMGVAKLAVQLGVSFDEAQALSDCYHAGVPFAKPTMQLYSGMAERYGVITTMLGRRSRFDLWEPRRKVEAVKPLPWPIARAKWGADLKLAECYKALNRRLQGTAADMMKLTMLRCYNEGIFAETGTPLLTVHDELVFSDSGDERSRKAFAEFQHVMETALPLRVPVVADGDIGPDWGHLHAA